MLNKVHLIGHVGKDPESKQVGTATVWKFPLATNENYKDANNQWHSVTEWHDISVWRSSLAKVVKGSLVYVEGKIKSNTVDTQNGGKKTYTTIRADVYRVLSGSSQSSTVQDDSTQNEEQDDLPF